MDIYAQNILDHYKHPRNFKKVPSSNTQRHEANPSCGDSIDMSIAIDNGVIADIGFLGEGCAISLASASLLTEHLRGKTIEEALSLKGEDVERLLGVSVSQRRKKCALLGLLTLQNALLAYQKKPLKKWSDVLSEGG